MHLLLLIVSFLLASSATAATAPETIDMAAVAAQLPQLECKVRAYRPSSDTAYNYRQLEKIEKSQRRCIKQYRQALETRALDVQAELLAAGPADNNRPFLIAQLRLIDYILMQDLTASKPSNDRPGPPVEVSQQFGHH